MNNHHAHREVLWNVSSLPNQVLLYLLFLLSLAVCCYGLWRRAQVWLHGKEDNSRFHSWGQRSRILFAELLGQKSVRQKNEVGLFHSLIFFGFFVLLFTTTMVFIDNDLGVRIYRGQFYLAVTILSDLFGLLLLIGVVLAASRRYIQRPDNLHNTPADFYMLGILALMVVQGFLLEALRIAATQDSWAAYSFVGNILSFFFWGLPIRSLTALHYLIWWFHTLTVFVFIALLPYTKFLHILTSTLNLFFCKLGKPKGALESPGDIEQQLLQAAESESGDFSIGIQTANDFTWKQRLDFDSCTSCGRCQEVCPAYNSGKMLSPKWLILDTRDHLLSLHIAASQSAPLQKADAELLKSLLFTSSEEPRAKNPLVNNEALKALGGSPTAKLAGEVLDEDVFWACTTCRACMEVCPVGIEHVDYIVDVRRSMALMDGNIPAEAQASLRSLETRGNPFGDPAQRLSWAEGLHVPILNPGDEVEVLYWVGCISAYDKRKQKIARSLVQILNSAQVSWGVLGIRENCTGDPARRLGEENLFQSLAKKNLEILHQVKFSVMLANCPHCFHSMKNEYPQLGTLGDKVRVVHHSQYLSELLESKKINVTSDPMLEATFHDPCYLGRYNNTYDEPREVLVQLGGKLQEMASSKETALCCGAGGGHYWFDMKVGDRINVQRVEQAKSTGAKLIGTACPFCMQMLEDGVKLKNEEDSLIVRDIAELVAERLA